MKHLPMPEYPAEVVFQVEHLSNITLSLKARNEMACLAEDCLSPEFLEDTGIDTLSGVLEDLEERLEVWVGSSKDNLRDARSAFCPTPEAYDANLKEAKSSLKAFKDGLKAVQEARARLG
jgi:hypothetical protein